MSGIKSTGQGKGKRVLILASLPFSKNNQSRAYESYFKYFDKNDTAWFYYANQPPSFEFGNKVFRITEKELFQQSIRLKKKNIGTIFEANSCIAKIEDPNSAPDSSFQKAMKQMKNGLFTMVARDFIWKFKNWHTAKFIQWCSDFSPEVIVLAAWGPNKCLLKAAQKLSKEFKVPLVAIVGDDYIFAKQSKLAIFKKAYIRSYKKLVGRILRNGTHVFISQKMRDKYCSEFSCSGIVIHVSSEKNFEPIKPFQTPISSVCYFGNLLLGRAKAVLQFANALSTKNSSVSIHLYTDRSSLSESDIEELNKHRNIVLHDPIPYVSIEAEQKKYDAQLIVESLDEQKYVDRVAYSLSTKVCDVIKSSNFPIVIGNSDTGAVGYMSDIKYGLVATNERDLESIVEILGDVQNINYLSDLYNLKGQQIATSEFSVDTSAGLFKELIDSL